MSLDKLIIEVIGGILLTLLALKLYVMSVSNPKAKIDDYHEWLSVLSSVAWKRSIEVSRDMALQKGVLEDDISLAGMYQDLGRLVVDGLVFEKQIPREVEGYSLMERHYILSSKGVGYVRDANAAREEDFAPA